MLPVAYCIVFSRAERGKERELKFAMDQSFSFQSKKPRSRQRQCISRTFFTSLLVLSFVGCVPNAWSFLQCKPFPTRTDGVLYLRRHVLSSNRNDVKEASLDTFVNEFVATVKQSLDNETFVSLILKGPVVSKKQRQDPDIKERLRGCVRQVHGRLIALPKRNTVCLQTTIKYHGATDVAKNYDIDQVIPCLTSLLLSDSNVVASEWGENAMYPCGTDLGIQNGELETTLGTWEFTAVPTRPPRLKFKPTTESKRNAAGASMPMSHDRTKQVPLSTKSSFLQALGLTTLDGKPRPAMKSKLKQCQKFVEIVSGLVESCMTNDITNINIADMGCGRGYLTFSLHAYLFERYGDMVQSSGIDMRPKLVKEISGIARSLGSEFDGLSFQEGTIEGILSDARPKGTSSLLKVLIALHACDTATDDALWSGIQSQCDAIVVAPCCHKEVRRQLDRHFSKKKSVHPLADVLRHNIYREQIAETVTDSLRALLLELANYKVQVFEFIGGEHTGKNVMITAVKHRRSRSDKELEGLRARIRDLASLHGVYDQRLAKWMDERIAKKDNTRTVSKRIISSTGMPPL